MTQAVNNYAAQLSPIHVLILNETMEIKQFLLSRVRAVGLLSAIECRISMGLPMQSHASNSMLRETIRDAAPRERDIAAYFELLMPLEFWTNSSSRPWVASAVVRG